MQELTAIFQNMSSTLEFGRRLEYFHRHQKLALEEELKRMEEMAKDKSLGEVQAVAPILVGYCGRPFGPECEPRPRPKVTQCQGVGASHEADPFVADHIFESMACVNNLNYILESCESFPRKQFQILAARNYNSVATQRPVAMF